VNDSGEHQRRPFLPRLESLVRSEIDALQGRKLHRQVLRIYEGNPFYRRLWKNHGVSPEDIRKRADIRRLPVVSKADFLADQVSVPPFGSRLGIAPTDVYEVMLSTGTSGNAQEVYGLTVQDAYLRGMGTAVGWYWSGLTKNDAAVFHIPASNSASLGTMLRGIRAVGRLPYLVGHEGFHDRLRLMEKFGVSAMYATPSGLNGLAQACVDVGIDPIQSFPALRFIMTSTESWPIEWIYRMEEFWHARIFEQYGSTQVNGGNGASCCELGAVVNGRRGGLHLFEWTILYEVVDPITMNPVQDGESGELIITHLDMEASPIMRYRTGDRVTYRSHTQCSCGRQYDLIEAGTIGRFDDMLKVKGQNLWPSELEPIIFAHVEIDEFQGRVYIGDKGRDEVELKCALKATAEDRAGEIANALVQELKDASGIRFNVKIVGRDRMPRSESTDRKARRWSDERYAGLGSGLNVPVKGIRE
jgi:phenylacetate-CoA ligase